MKTNKLSHSALRNMTWICVCVCVGKEMQGERFSINGLTRGWNGRNAKEEEEEEKQLRGEVKFWGEKPTDGVQRIC
jgi:hypothetical protein